MSNGLMCDCYSPTCKLLCEILSGELHKKGAGKEDRGPRFPEKKSDSEWKAERDKVGATSTYVRGDICIFIYVVYKYIYIYISLSLSLSFSNRGSGTCSCVPDRVCEESALIPWRPGGAPSFSSSSRPLA